MKKLLFLAIFIPCLVYGDGPYFKHKDPITQQEFELLYQDVRGILYRNGNNICIDPGTFCVDIVNHKIYMSSTTLTMDGTNPTFSQTVGGSIASYIITSSSFGINGNNVRATASAKTFTIPDVTANFVMSEGAATINGSKTFGSPVILPAGTVSAPSVNFSDSGTGFYRNASNQIGVALNGVKSFDSQTTGSADNTGYIPLQIYGGGSSRFAQEFINYSTGAVNTQASQIASLDLNGCQFLVYGADGAGNDFMDQVLASFYTVTPGVVSFTARGAPAARTYTQAGSGVLKLSMASGSYTVRTVGTCIGAR